MKKMIILALAPLAFVIGAHAATGTDTAVTTSADPAKAAAVERHAQELAARDTKPATETTKAKVTKVASKRHHRHHAQTKTKTQPK